MVRSNNNGQAAIAMVVNLVLVAGVIAGIVASVGSITA